MSNITLICPQCQTEIEVTEVMKTQLAADIRGQLQADFTAKLQKLNADRDALAKERQAIEASQAEFDQQLKAAIAKQRAALVEKVRLEAQQAMAVEIADRDEQLKSAQAKLKTFETQELELRRKTRKLEQKAEQQELDLARKLDEQRKTLQQKLQAEYADKSTKLANAQEQLTIEREQLEVSRASLDEQVAAALNNERGKLTEKLRNEAHQAAAVEIADRDEQLKSSQAKLKAFETQELELRRKTRELEQQAEQQELEVARKLDEERKAIRAAALKQADEQASLKLAERDQKIEALADQLKEAQRKLDQGSQQTQGDVQELALEGILAEMFPSDVIERVGKGEKGGDVLHHVFDTRGRECGVILWESKRTKAWNKDWVGKAIDDQQAAKAPAVCIVSAVLPAGIENLDQKSGVWIASWSCVRLVAGLLRHSLLEVSQARAATDGQHSKMEMLYNYMASEEVRSRLRGIVEPYLEMEKDLHSEMRVINARWKKRRKQLDRVMMSASGLYGDLQGIIGSGLQEIEAMELLALESQVETEDKEMEVV